MESAKHQVILYTRPCCHLCDEAKQAMNDARCDDEYTLQEVNIETDRQLLHKYRNDIPVILIDGRETFRHRLTSDAFRKRINEKAKTSG